MVCLVLLLAKLIKSIALSVWNTTKDMKLYVEAVSWTGLVNGWYNIVTFLCALDWFILLEIFAEDGSFHLFIVSGSWFFNISILKTNTFCSRDHRFWNWVGKYDGDSYLMVIHNIQKNVMGFIWGIINMMIVIPMFIQTITFGYVLKTFLNNDPRLAISFAGVLLLISAGCTLLIKTKKKKQVNDLNYKAIELQASSEGFLASAQDISNYKRVWARDGVICGLAALASGDEN
jgi:maltose/moltooligosaccharide transporter